MHKTLRYAADFIIVHRKGLIVCSVWLIMTLVALGIIFSSHHNVPFKDDWMLVNPLAGREPNLLKWLWYQNNEHRVPFPRLILLGLLKVTKWDFRAGMYFNVLLLAILAMCMILVSRQLRGGRTSLADVFFPIALLHLGNAENLFFSSQITFVVPTVLTLGVCLAILCQPYLRNAAAALPSGICVILLPLSGANGLLYVPLLALWLIYCGIIKIYKFKSEERCWISVFLIGSATTALCFGFLYFIDLKSPDWWKPANHEAILIAAAKILAYGLGPAVEKSWSVATIIVNSFLLITLIATIIAFIKNKGRERQRALFLFLFLGNVLFSTLAFGWGRAGMLPEWGFATRYVLIGAPAFISAFFIWLLYGSRSIRPLIHYGLVLGMLILLPFNTDIGLGWRYYVYEKGMEKLEKDISSGLSALTIAERNGDFLIHWWEHKELADAMLILKAAGIGAFTNINTGNNLDTTLHKNDHD